MKNKFDVIVVGAGAAGMMCAARAAEGGSSVLLIDHARKLGEKIRISGGGRCNFTNINTQWTNYVSSNPRFCRYALMAYTPRDFIDLIERYNIAWHEKHKGQLFCDESSELIINMLANECERGNVAWQMPCSIESIDYASELYRLHTDRGDFSSKQLVIATGGMAIPALGATDFGLKIARQFGHKIVEPRPALVPLTFDDKDWREFSGLSGVAVAGEIANGKDKKAQRFEEDILFTHRGLSGPGILQISSYWQTGSEIYLNLVPGDLYEQLIAKKSGSKQQLLTVLYEHLPKRLAQTWLATFFPSISENLAEISDKTLRQLVEQLQNWAITPSGTVGYKKAEAMSGGVDTRQIDQKTMESKKQEGLYFVGEVMDVTGWLGGYNFQWAWASAVACAKALNDKNTNN